MFVRWTSKSVVHLFAVQDLNEFVHLVRNRGLVHESNERPTAESPGVQPASRKQSILYWRKRLVDPDRLLTKIEPFLSFFWTPAFAVFSALSIVVATSILWSHWHDFASDFQHILHWKTVAILWISLLVITACHELAHGLTCKHYGGEVHEIGFLMMFFLPGMYCNVSDAWLFPEKQKRLLVTLAGGYFELFLWSLSVFLWRITARDELMNYVAFVIATVTGTRVFFYFNPLLKLDGYYLLLDLTGITNLRGRAIQYLKANVRWLLWGAPRPSRETNGLFLLGFGAASWAFSIVFLSVIGLAFYGYLNAKWGTVSAAAIVGCLGLIATRPVFRGFAQGEFKRMLRSRIFRTASWLAVIAALIAVLSFVEVPDRVGGNCELRPAARTEIRAPVAGFLKAVHYGEGAEIGPGSLVARLEVPDLDSRIAKTAAEIAESQAKLKLLQVGARPEEIDAEQARLQRLRKEADYLKSVADRLRIHSPDEPSVLTTPRLHEKIGSYFEECNLIFELENSSTIQVEIALPEKHARRIEPNQKVTIKLRSLPFETHHAKVMRIAPTSVRKEEAVQGTVTIYCELDNEAGRLRSGTTGYARIHRDAKPIGRIMFERATGFLRSEFWW